MSVVLVAISIILSAVGYCHVVWWIYGNDSDSESDYDSVEDADEVDGPEMISIVVSDVNLAHGNTQESMHLFTIEESESDDESWIVFG